MTQKYYRFRAMNIQNSDATNCTLKLRDYEKPTKFEKKYPTCFDKTAVFTQYIQNKWDFFKIFVAFSEKLNFTNNLGMKSV